MRELRRIRVGRMFRKAAAVLALMLMLLPAAAAMPVHAEEPAPLSGTVQTTLRKKPREVSGRWKKVKNGYRFVCADGRRVRGWLKIGPAVYYLDKNGTRKTGQVKLGGKYYYFRRNGVQRTGYVRIGKRTYYFDPGDHGARSSSVIFVNGVPNLAPEKKDAGQETDRTARSERLALTFDENGTFYDRKGYAVEKATLKKLLQTALQPVGRTMYIWGGGWAPKADGTGNAGSEEAVTIGVSPRWEQFFRTAKKGYNYRNYRFLSHLGLDCSGYVGWVIYNTLNSADGHGDYVMLAQSMARTFSNWGWGKYRAAGRFRDFRPGDIMSLGAGHVYIVIGQCSDGSVVLVHSSPKGVMITGTATRSGKKNSRAVKLAKKYMKKYYPKWYRKYPDSSRSASYLTQYARMRWNLSGNRSVLSDPDGIAKMSAQEVLKVLFGEA